MFLLLYTIIEEYHHYDLFVLPKVTIVTKGFLNQVKEKATAVVGLLWGAVSRHSAADTKEEFSKEAMAKQCLAFYLEQYKSLLLHDEEFPKEFRVDHLIETLSTIYFQHLTPLVKYRNGSPAQIAIKPIQAVSYYFVTSVHVHCICTCTYIVTFPYKYSV